MEEVYSLSQSRRVYPRFKVESTSFLRINKENIPVFLRDISSRGAGIISRIPFAVQNSVEIIADIPFSKATISKAGKIVWCNKQTDNLFRLGIDFGPQDKIVFS